MRTLHPGILAIVFASHVAYGLVLPVCEVAERAQREVSTYPGRVVPIAQVDVTPQVSGEILGSPLGTVPLALMLVALQ